MQMLATHKTVKNVSTPKPTGSATAKADTTDKMPATATAMDAGVATPHAHTDATVETSANSVLIQRKIEQSVLRTAELFALTKRNASSAFEFAPSKKVRIHTKLNGMYLNLPESLLEDKKQASVSAPTEDDASEETEAAADPVPAPVKSLIEEIALEAQAAKINRSSSGPLSGTSAVVEYKKPAVTALAVAGSGSAQFGSSAIVRRRPTQVPKPKWHAPWKLKRVIAGHLGWVRSVAVDPTNDWFVTGSADRTIKVWDLASGQLKLTLTGHINTIRGLEVSPRHPYLFSAGEDKKVLCWDLEYNKVIRSYHGHLSGVFSLKVHPTLDILMTGGRDAVTRVWDMRTKNQIHVLSGHEGTVWGVETQATDPQVITGSSDSTIKLWDLAAGKVMTTLTNHKKGVRALAKSPVDHSFISGAADNLKKWDAKDGRFLRNFSGHNAIINSVAVNEDSVMVSSADNGTMRFWDYTTGYCFQQEATKVQPGSLDSEAGIYASTFDKTGMRFITAEADKTIKIWAEDTEASEDTHPIDMAQWTKEFTAPKRY